MQLDELIATLKEDPARFAVCADALLAAGEPQGQLMALHLRGLADPALEGELGQLVRRVLGEVEVEFGWRWGFIDAVRWSGWNGFEPIEDSYVELARLLRTKVELVPALPWSKDISASDRLRVHRLLSRLKTLHIGPWEGRPRHDQLWQLLAREGLPPSVTELIASDVPHPHRDEHQITWVELGDLSLAGDSLRQLERLRLRGSYLHLGQLDLPRLEEFSLFSSTFSEVSAIRSARWPRLQKLSLAFGDETYNPRTTPIDELVALVREVPVTVKHLGLRNLLHTDALIAPLAKSAVLKRLTQLDLSFGVLLERGAASLEQHAAAFAHLEVLDVTDTGLTRFDEMKERIPGLHRGPEWRTKVERYVSVSE